MLRWSIRSSTLACKVSTISDEINRCVSSRSCRINFLPSARVSSRCRRNCFIAGSLEKKRIMSKKRGLSAEEKRTKMLEIFHNSRDFFQLKELEKIAPKLKGITMQSVKEVVTSLVDDNLVDSEKIGTSIYFWSFPSKVKNAKKRKLMDLQNELEDNAKKIKKTQEAIDAESVGREESAERSEILSTLEKVEKQEAELKVELQKYRDSDPEYIAQLRNEIQELKTAINRWTENIYILKSYCKNTFQVENEVLEQSFNIPQDLDYIEI